MIIKEEDFLAELALFQEQWGEILHKELMIFWLKKEALDLDKDFLNNLAMPYPMNQLLIKRLNYCIIVNFFYII